jgi:glycosyltransferase involved in cell wall biosynthesis
MANNIISVIIPTRKRPDALLSSIRSLIDTATFPTRIEIHIGVDEDDPDTVAFVRNEGGSYLQQNDVDCRVSVFKPIGFENIHAYVNTLAANAKGDWLLLWQDDAIMLTDGWDTVVDSYAGQFKLLAPKDNHNGNPNAIFPIIPRDWMQLIEHISVHPHTDAWVSHIAYMVDIFERVDIEVLHDRADITGNNEDETYHARISKEGNPDEAGDFGHPDMQQTRVRTAYKLAWFLDRIGQKSDWWERVQKGEQDPFEKFKANTNEEAIGMGPIKTTPDTAAKERMPDNATLSL